MCPPIWAHFRHLENMIELMLPSVHPSPQPKRQINRFSHFCTAHGRRSYYFTTGDPFPKNCPFSRGIWTPSNSWLGHSEPTIQTAAISVQPFSHRWPQSVTILHNGTPLSSLKIVHSHGGSGPPSNTWLPRLTRVLNPNGISIGSAVFAQLTSVTDRQTFRQTDRPRYSVGNNRPHLRYVVRAMRSIVCIVC